MWLLKRRQEGKRSLEEAGYIESPEYTGKINQNISTITHVDCKNETDLPVKGEKGLFNCILTRIQAFRKAET